MTAARAPGVAQPGGFRARTRARVSALGASLRTTAVSVSARRPRGVWPAAAVVLVAAFSWRDVGLQGGPGIDPSWSAGLSMAVHQGIDFGPHLIFTYGPLGFLESNSIWFAHLGAISFLYGSLIRLLLAWALFGGLRRSFGSGLAFVLAVIAESVINDVSAGEPIVAMIALSAAVASTGDRSLREIDAIVTLSAAAGGFNLLTKISIGVMLAGMTAVFIWSLPGRRWRAVGFAAGGGVAGLLIPWMVLGESLGAIPSYLANSQQVVSGYAAALGLAIPGTSWQGTAAIVSLAVGVWAGLHSTYSLRPRQRTAVVALWVIFWFVSMKEGFVRDDSGHLASFFAAMLGGYAAFRWRPGYRALALLLASYLFVLTLAAEGVGFSPPVAPLTNLSNMVTQVSDISSSSHRYGLIRAGKAAVRAAFALPSAMLGLLGGDTVAVYPNELSVAWAYSLRWDPLPVLQSYAAYTPSLDQLDATFLSAPDAPERILVVAPFSIDDRVLSFDQPQTARAMLCHYRQAFASPVGAVLARVGNRCSTPVLLRAERVGWDQPVQVPRPPSPGSLVFVRITGAGVHGLETLRALLFRPRMRYVTINGTRFRLVASTAPDGLPLILSSHRDFTAPYNIAPLVRTISVSQDAQAPTSSGPLTFSFYAEQVAPVR